MMDRFDLEQKIMKCWHVTDDVDMVATMVGDMSSMSARDQDKLMNVLLGIKVLYDARFEDLFNTFGILVREGRFKDVAWNPDDFEGLDDLWPDKDEMP